MEMNVNPKLHMSGCEGFALIFRLIPSALIAKVSRISHWFSSSPLFEFADVPSELAVPTSQSSCNLAAVVELSLSANAIWYMFSTPSETRMLTVGKVPSRVSAKTGLPSGSNNSNILALARIARSYRGRRKEGVARGKTHRRADDVNQTAITGCPFMLDSHLLLIW
jgi:hypothetical protein